MKDVEWARKEALPGGKPPGGQPPTTRIRGESLVDR